jgi:hypothetical protein
VKAASSCSVAVSACAARLVAVEGDVNNVPGNISNEQCLGATDALIRRGLLVELTADEIEADRARWRAETLPVSWGVDREAWWYSRFERVASGFQVALRRVDGSRSG